MKTSRAIPVVFLVSLTYAALRYIVFKGLPLDHLPLYVTNKAVSMTALFLLGASHVSASRTTRKDFGMASFAVAALHGLLSLALLSPGYYPKLYLSAGGADGYALTGEAVLLAGALGLFSLFILAWPKAPDSQAIWGKRIPLIVRGVLGLTALHCLLLGGSGWWDPSTWPGYLPPITLMSFAFAVGSLLLGLKRRRQGGSAGAA